MTLEKIQDIISKYKESGRLCPYCETKKYDGKKIHVRENQPTGKRFCVVCNSEIITSITEAIRKNKKQTTTSGVKAVSAPAKDIWSKKIT